MSSLSGIHSAPRPF